MRKRTTKSLCDRVEYLDAEVDRLAARLLALESRPRDQVFDFDWAHGNGADFDAFGNRVLACGTTDWTDVWAEVVPPVADADGPSDFLPGMETA